MAKKINTSKTPATKVRPSRRSDSGGFSKPVKAMEIPPKKGGGSKK